MKSNSRSGSRRSSQASKRSESRSHSCAKTSLRYRRSCSHRKKSHSGSYTTDYRRSQSASPMSSRRRHASNRAMEQVNGIELDGRRIRVDYSITKRAHTPTPGVYMGRPTQSFGGGGGSIGGHRQDSYYDRGYDPI